AQVAFVGGRRLFVMARAEWQQLRSHEGRLVEINLERVERGGVAMAAAAIAALAAGQSVHAERVEVWPYSETEAPSPAKLQNYVVLEDLTQRINVVMFAKHASVTASPQLRKHLREHVFVARQETENGRWEPKTRAVERIVFLRR